MADDADSVELDQGELPARTNRRRCSHASDSERRRPISTARRTHCHAVDRIRVWCWSRCVVFGPVTFPSTFDVPIYLQTTTATTLLPFIAQ